MGKDVCFGTQEGYKTIFKSKPSEGFESIKENVHLHIFLGEFITKDELNVTFRNKKGGYRRHILTNIGLTEILLLLN